MENNDNPLMDITEISMLIEEHRCNLYYYLKKYKFVPPPIPETHKLYRKSTIIEWWKMVKKDKAKRKELKRERKRNGSV